MDIKSLLSEYASLTEHMIDKLRNEDFKEVEEMIFKRDMIITEINNLSYTKDEFSKICKTLSLTEKEASLNILLEKSKERIKLELSKVKSEIEGIERKKAVNKTYAKVYSQPADPMFLSKKF